MNVPEVAEGLSVSTDRDGDRVTVSPVGYVDLSTAPGLGRRVRAYLALGVTDVEIDAGRITFMDSTGLALLADMRDTLIDRGGQVRVTNAPRGLIRVFEVTGMSDLLA